MPEVESSTPAIARDTRCDRARAFRDGPVQPSCNGAILLRFVVLQLVSGAFSLRNVPGSFARCPTPY